MLQIGNHAVTTGIKSGTASTHTSCTKSEGTAVACDKC
jgi:hypothetical protein